MAITAGTVLVLLIVDYGSQFLPLIGIATLFGVIGFYLLLESYSTKGYFDRQHIYVTSYWSKSKRGLWKDLGSVAFKKNGQYFELLCVDGTKIALSKMLRGHGAVCAHVESLGVHLDDV